MTTDQYTIGLDILVYSTTWTTDVRLRLNHCGNELNRTEEASSLEMRAIVRADRAKSHR